MEFSRQEYWSGLPFPSPGDLPNPGIQPASPVLAGGFFTTELPGKSLIKVIVCVSHAVVSDSAILWTVACQALLSMEFSRPEYWSGLPFLFPGDLPNPRMEPRSALQADSLPSEPPGSIKRHWAVAN